MSSIETTELKLKTTPTGGVESSHSPYYRRLVSAGYKGFLQGTIGGASFYGTAGAVIGGLIAIPFLFTPVGWAALALVPAAAGIGIFKGASTFGNIGSVAAINAESADLSEQRRYLLDRYYDLPEGPEGDKEAAAIKKELERASADTNKPHPFFHWKTVAVCAAVGAALMLGLGALAPGLLGAHAGILGIIGEVFEATHLGAAAGPAIGALAGALTGSVIGIDRYYVRKWFDHTENLVHASSHTEEALRERSEQVGRLQEAAKEDQRTRTYIEATRDTNAQSAKRELPEAPTSSAPITPTMDAAPTTAAIAASNDAQKPSNTVSAARRIGLADIQKAMDIPAI